MPSSLTFRATFTLLFSMGHPTFLAHKTRRASIPESCTRGVKLCLTRNTSCGESNLGAHRIGRNTAILSLCACTRARKNTSDAPLYAISRFDRYMFLHFYVFTILHALNDSRVAAYRHYGTVSTEISFSLKFLLIQSKVISGISTFREQECA